MEGPFLAKLTLILMGFKDRDELERFDKGLKELLSQFNVNAVGGMEAMDVSKAILDSKNKSDDSNNSQSGTGLNLSNYTN